MSEIWLREMEKYDDFYMLKRVKGWDVAKAWRYYREMYGDLMTYAQFSRWYNSL